MGLRPMRHPPLRGALMPGINTPWRAGARPADPSAPAPLSRPLPPPPPLHGVRAPAPAPNTYRSHGHLEPDHFFSLHLPSRPALDGMEVRMAPPPLLTTFSPQPTASTSALVRGPCLMAEPAAAVSPVSTGSTARTAADRASSALTGARSSREKSQLNRITPLSALPRRMACCFPRSKRSGPRPASSRPPPSGRAPGQRPRRENLACACFRVPRPRQSAGRSRQTPPTRWRQAYLRRRVTKTTSRRRCGLQGRLEARYVYSGRLQEGAAARYSRAAGRTQAPGPWTA
jgi:hypothetical protein